MMNWKTEYVPPTLTVDSVIFQLDKKELTVLLIQRSQEPFLGAWALPGGYNPAGETTQDAMKRILKVKGGIDTKSLKLIEQLYTFDTVARDPRGHAVSVTYMGLGLDLSPLTGHTTQNPHFFPVNNLPELAYDHQKIIRYGHERLQSKVTYTNAVFALLPERFTLSHLQAAYEAILCKPLDKRNFRKKFLSLCLIKPTTEKHREGAHRPAQLYTFNSQELEALSRSFD